MLGQRNVSVMSVVEDRLSKVQEVKLTTDQGLVR